jgi:hypothetical protein
MSENKSRDHNEAAFGHTEPRFFSRGSAVEELDHVTRSRDEKTARLREARLAREEHDRLFALKAPAVKTRQRP